MKKWTSMDRRRFLKLSSAVSTGLVISTQMYGCSSKHFVLPENQVEFNHGVASGDPTHSAIVLWTRATPANSQDTQVHLVWQLAKDSSFTQIVREGSAQASKVTDYTVKVDVRDLEENQAYYYRFITQKNSSVTGTTRTLPKSTVEQVKLGIFSCSNYPAGFFNPYMAASQDSEIDVVLHLGDYIYEYSSTGMPLKMHNALVALLTKTTRENCLHLMTTANATRHIAPIKACKRCIKPNPLSLFGMIMKLLMIPTTKARKTTMKAKVISLRAERPPCKPIMNGCQFVLQWATHSLTFIARLNLVIWLHYIC